MVSFSEKKLGLKKKFGGSGKDFPLFLGPFTIGLDHKKLLSVEKIIGMRREGGILFKLMIQDQHILL